MLIAPTAIQSLLSTSAAAAAPIAITTVAHFTAATTAQADEKLRQLNFLALFAIAESLNRAFSAWTSLSVICFGVCELSIRCGYAPFSEPAPGKD